MTIRFIVRSLTILTFVMSTVLIAGGQPNTTTPAFATGNFSGGTDPHAGAIPWQSFVGIPIGGYMSLSVNTVSGNLLAGYSMPTIPGVAGLDENFSLRYNSYDRSPQGSTGFGWGMASWKDVGLNIANPNAPIFVDGSGHAWTFTKSGGIFTSPPGIDADLIQNGNGSYTLTAHSSQSKLQFDSGGNLTAVQDRSGNQISYQYGSIGKIINTEGQTTSFLSTNNLAFLITEPDTFRKVSLSYAGGTLLGIDYHDNGARTAFAYDANRDLTKITDRNGNITLITYAGGVGPAVASVTTVTNTQTMTGPTWSFSYGTGSTAVTDPNNHTTSYGYDGSGRTTSVTYPDMTSSQQSWNADNQVSSSTTPSGNTTTYTFDSLNRLMQVSLPPVSGISMTKSWAYTNATFPYNPSSSTDEQGHTTQYAYNGQGLVNSVTDANSHTSTAIYNSNGTLASSTDANNNATTYSYFAGGLLQQVTPQTVSCGVRGRCFPQLGPTSYTYTANAWVSTITDGKGQATTYSYDGPVRPVLLKSAAWRVEEGAEEQPMS